MLLALPLGAFVLRHLDPQNEMRMRQIAAKQGALRRTLGQPRLLVCGDSSVSFGINPEVLRATTGLASINLGYSAASGALALLGVAEEAAQPGDTLVLSIIPSLMDGAVQSTPEGRLMAMMYGHPEIAVGGREPLIPFTPTERLRTWLSAYSPSQRVVANDLGRRLMGMQGYRYSTCVLDQWGYIANNVVIPHGYGEFHPPKLSQAWHLVLEKYVAWMHARGVRVFYALPWFEVPTGGAERGAQDTRACLDDINQVVEVLRGEPFELKEDTSLFADTEVHLTLTAAAERSRQLGQAVNAVADHQTHLLENAPAPKDETAANTPTTRTPGQVALGVASVASCR